MIQVTSFVILLICFFATTILSEKYFTKNPPRFSIYKTILIVAVVLVALTTFIAIFPSMIELIAYLIVIVGTVASIYVRHRSDQNKGWR